VNAKIQEKTTIEVPPGLELALNRLVTEYALAHREEPAACRRGVEIAVLQKGVRALAEELKANAALGERMGWAKEEVET
jgi:hypothetical protein